MSNIRVNPFYITVQSLPQKTEIDEEEKELLKKGAKKIDWGKEITAKYGAEQGFSYKCEKNGVDVWFDGKLWYIQCWGENPQRFTTAKKEKAQVYAIDIVRYWMGEKTKYEHIFGSGSGTDISLDSYVI